MAEMIFLPDVEIDIKARIRFGRRIRRIQLFVVDTFEGGICRMSSFTMKAGQQKAYVVIGFADDGQGGEVEIGQVPATVISSDNHTIQVSDKGDGSGTVTAVGSPGGSATVTADDGQGHTDSATGSIETPPTVTRIELRVLDLA